MHAYKTLLISVLLGSTSSLSLADSFEWSDVGFRGGIDAESDLDIQSYELFTTIESPWEWDVNDLIELRLDFELSGGVLDGEGETSVFTHAAPRLEIEIDNLPFEIIASSGPAYLSEHEFKHRDLGGSFQFMSAIGFDFEVVDDWTFGYRFRHISNAGIYEKNPGLDLHLITLAYGF